MERSSVVLLKSIPALVSLTCGHIAVVPSLKRISSVAPGSIRFVVRVSAIVMVSESSVRIVRWCSGVPMWALFRPFLTTKSRECHMERSSIVLLETIPKFVSRAGRNVTVVPSLKRISSVAPGSIRFVVRVSAIVVISESSVRIVLTVFWSAHVGSVPSISDKPFQPAFAERFLCKSSVSHPSSTLGHHSTPILK